MAVAAAAASLEVPVERLPARKERGQVVGVAGRLQRMGGGRAGGGGRIALLPATVGVWAVRVAMRVAGRVAVVGEGGVSNEDNRPRRYANSTWRPRGREHMF